MTIIYTDGDILMDQAEAIVIPVNTVGVPGAGLAKSWAKKDPIARGIYESLCDKGLIKVGEVTTIRSGDQRWIMFPTKIHWEQPSVLEWIERGLIDLERNISNFQSIAIPALGCGLGGLQWREVKLLIEIHLSHVDIPIHVYAPKR
jgi:O-acetyl-ADP-ribose deacetylase (regulator of RNase III)